ncbi:MAG: hypothetical protein WBD40_09570 [Tepidisphaeraceae bacterium]
MQQIYVSAAQYGHECMQWLENVEVLQQISASRGGFFEHADFAGRLAEARREADGRWQLAGHDEAFLAGAHAYLNRTDAADRAAELLELLSA